MKCAQVSSIFSPCERPFSESPYALYVVFHLVSQVEQAANLTSEGYELVGWFHSHPTFEANPSRTDVATQADMQLQFSMESDRPFIGFIINCLDMNYK